MRSLILVSVLCFGLPALAHDGKHEEAKDKTGSKPSPSGPKDKKASKLLGEVVDLTCYLSHDGQGAKHAKCALDCIKKGNPVAILSGGTLFAVISSDHEAPNTKLAAFAGKQVVATGEQSEKNGLHFIDLETVEEQAAPKK